VMQFRSRAMAAKNADTCSSILGKDSFGFFFPRLDLCTRQVARGGGGWVLLDARRVKTRGCR
jgi:hypothetical protein